MAEGEIKYRISADNRQAERKLKETTRSTKALGRVVDKTGDQASRAAKQHAELARNYNQLDRRARGARTQTDSFGQSLKGAAKSVASLAGGMLGVGGVVAAFRAYASAIAEANRHLKENARLQRDAINASTEARFLGASTEDINEARRAAAEQGLDPTAGVNLLAEIKSRRGQSSTEQQQRIINEILESATTTQGGIKTVADPLLTLQSQLPGRDPKRAQNILFKTIEQAGEKNPAALGPAFGDIIGEATTEGGLSVAEAGGFISGITGQGLPTRRAATAGKRLIQLLGAQRSQTGKEVLPEIGVPVGTDTITALERVKEARDKGEISEKQFAGIFGTEAGPLAGILTKDEVFKKFKSRIQAVRQAGQADPSQVNLTGERLAEIEAESPRFRLNRAAKRQEAQEKVGRQSSTKATQQKFIRSTLSRQLEEEVLSGDISAAEKNAALEVFDDAVARGFSTAKAVEQALTLSVPSDIGSSTIGIPVGVGAGTPGLDAATGDVRSGVIEGIENAGGNVEVGSTFRSPEGITNINIAQQFNGAKDPDTGDLDDAVRGKRPDQ